VVHAVNKTYTFDDVALFTKITGDTNHLHHNQEEAISAGFPATIVPGILLVSLFPAIIGSLFPGAIYVSQTAKFRNPAVIGKTVHAEVEVMKHHRDFVFFRTTCKATSTGLVHVEGEAVAKINKQQE
jgi:3-hydroxybutyryl-CoA dehydratase